MNKSSLGSKLLREEIVRRELSYQAVADQLLELGAKTQRYSVWQWANALSKPSIDNAFAVAKWSENRVPPDSWTKKS